MRRSSYCHDGRFADDVEAIRVASGDITVRMDFVSGLVGRIELRDVVSLVLALAKVGTNDDTM